jgi:tight adherence protein B
MVLFFAIFVFLFLVAALCIGLARAFFVSRQKQQIRTMLKRAEAEAGKGRPDLLKAEIKEDALSRALSDVHAFQKLNALIEQSGMDWKLGKFAALTLFAALAGIFAGFLLPGFSRTAITAFLPGIMAGLFPLFVVLRKRAKRLARFEEQFPEALNFLGRSMRAGHAFSIGLEMLVADSPEPLHSVFRQMLNDLHLGSTLESCLTKLAETVPLIDVRFFVSAVLLQQGTGGNLAEILDSMANIIRERFRLKGQVKAASAHGRITGLILSLMPLVVAALLFLTSPAYLMILARDPDGRKMVIGAAIGQLVGFLCIRKIVNIKV